MKRKSSLIVYPILFGLYPFLNLYANNLRKAFRFSELALPIALTLGITLAVWLILGLVWRNLTKAAFVCLVLQMLFFSYGHVYDFLVDTLAWRWLTDAHLFAAWLLLLAAALFLVLKWGQRLDEFNGALNLVAVVLISFPVFSIARASQLQPSYDPANLLGEPFEIQPTANGYGKALPDIYYIILDGFPREDVLAEFYEYDSSAFSGRLRELGFYVADESQTNYIHTVYAMIAALSADYLQTVLEDYDLEGQPWTVLNEMLGSSVMCPTFKQIGYSHILYDNTLPAFSQSACADTVRGYNHLNQLDTILLQTTLLRPFMADTVTESYRNSQQFILDDLPEVARLPQPTFTYAHILLPHPPMVFGRNGEEVEIVDEKYWSTPGAMNPELRDAYLDQTIYTADQIVQTVEQILANSSEPPIIIVQSDHGSFPPTENSFGARYLRERVPILNAYYLPHDGDDLLYPSISPVNSFRVVLNHYFGADLPYLEDRTYHTALFDENPFDYVDVTHETVYQDEKLKILRTWNQARYLVQSPGLNAIEFPAAALSGANTEITDPRGWTIALQAESTTRHTVRLHDPAGKLVGTGFIDTAGMNPYDFEPQVYEDFAAYRADAAPISPGRVLEAPNLSARTQDADLRSIGSYISLARELSAEERADLYDLMLLLEYPNIAPEAAPNREAAALLEADYVLVKDSDQWRQEQSTADWFLLHTPSHLRHVRTWSIDVGDRLEPIRYDLYQVVQGSLRPTFVLPEFYQPQTPVVVSTPSLELNAQFRELLLAGIDPQMVFDLVGLQAGELPDRTLNELAQWLDNHESFWYVGAPEAAAGEGYLMEQLYNLGYVRGRARPSVQALERDLYYSDLRIFSFHRLPSQAAPLYTFGQEPIRLHGWSLDTPDSLTAGQEMRLQTWWSSGSGLDRYYRMSVVLTRPDGEFVTQQDLELSEVMMTEWQTDAIYLDERWLTIPCNLRGEYDLRISLYDYDYDTGEISGLPMLDAGGETVEAVILTRLTVAPDRSLSQCGDY